MSLGEAETVFSTRAPPRGRRGSASSDAWPGTVHYVPRTLQPFRLGLAILLPVGCGAVVRSALLPGTTEA
jgi:hypothetical protein